MMIKIQGGNSALGAVYESTAVPDAARLGSSETMGAGMCTRDDILRDYFLHLVYPGDPELYDRVEYVDKLVRTSPIEAWEIIRALAGIAPSDEALAYLAAGPLEDLLLFHGDLVASRIRQDALESQRVRDALSRVLLHPVSEAVTKALGEWLY